MKTPQRLRKRSQFLAMRSGERIGTRVFSLEWRARIPSEGVADSARFGFTVTRKAGNAVQRNRIRRRLREAVRVSAGPLAVPDHDYVLVGRASALNASFEEILGELGRALDRARRFNANPPRLDRPLPDRKGATPPKRQHPSR